MEFTAQKISELIGGRVEGDSSTKVSMLSKIEEGTPGTLSFLANPKYASYIYDTGASIVIVANDFVAEKEIKATLIRVKDPYESFARLLEVYQQMQQTKVGIETPAFIDPEIKIHDDCYIGAFSYIAKNAKIGRGVKIYPQVFIGENVEVGDHTVLFAGVKIYNDCRVGKNCTLHSGVIVGADGFGFAPQSGTEFKKVAQIGNVIIEDNVEIGSNTTVDRATLGSTIIRKGVKLDNLIQIAHNVEIGENTVIAAQTGVSGSTKIGRDCMIGGQVGIVGHIKIADKVKIAAQSGIGASILEEGDIVQGSPAYKAGDYRRSYVLYRKLPELEKRISELEHALLAAKSLNG